MKSVDAPGQCNEATVAPNCASTSDVTAEEVREAAASVLTALQDCRRVRIIRVMEIDREEGRWEVEAEVLFPNVTVASLGLSLQREVLDSHTYLVRLDRQLKVRGYGRKDLIDDGRA
ncbi:MAG: hypothetical protein HY315_00755 [Acidobacteria bacterium]|nr:hypothetical protein [Acidobacteriota bacterium]